MPSARWTLPGSMHGSMPGRAECPLCHGDVHPIAGRCRHCRADLVAARAEGLVPVPPVIRARKTPPGATTRGRGRSVAIALALAVGAVIGGVILVGGGTDTAEAGRKPVTATTSDRPAGPLAPGASIAVYRDFAGVAVDTACKRLK